MIVGVGQSLRAADASSRYRRGRSSQVIEQGAKPLWRRECPACRSERTEPAFVKAGYHYRRCQCGTVFVADVLRRLDVCAQYSEGYFEAQKVIAKRQRGGYPSYLAAQNSLKDSFMRKLSFVRERVPRGALLDVGAAYGTFVQLASKHYDCVGMDVSSYAISVAQRLSPARFIVGDIQEETDFVAASFDAIAMWDIIEHLAEPIAALSEVHRILKPGGFVFISTDDVNNWLPRFAGRVWWSLAPPLHLCHFSKEGMLRAFWHAGGFEPVEFFPDTRAYRLADLLEHLAVSYSSRSLARIAQLAKMSGTGGVRLVVRRPEQFILAARKAGYTTARREAWNRSC